VAEPDISGVGQAARPVASGFEFKVPGLEKTASQLAAVTSELNSLKNALQSMSSQQGQLLQGVNGIFSQVQAGANSTASALNNAGGGGGGTTSSGIPFNFSAPGGSGANPFAAMTQSLTADSSIAGMLSAVMQAPIKYAYGRFEEARANAPTIASALGSTATLSGKTITQLIEALQEGTPVQGDLNNVLGAINQASMIGYGNFGTARSGAFFEGVRQMQALTPGVGATDLVNMQGNFLSSTQTHQRSLMLTGGAMSGFGSGAIPKTLSEWATSTLKWFESQRPGAQRGKKFTKEELITQQFPGSNMDAWFSATGVPEYMQQYFWQYVIGAAHTGTNDFVSIIEARGPDLAMSRLRTQTAQGRREFQMLGSASNYEDFNTREGSDRYFEAALGQVDRGLGTMLGAFGGDLISRIPTPLANLLVNGGLGMTTNVASSLASFFFGGGGRGPVGDPGGRRGGRRGRGRALIGDASAGYGVYGGTTTAHMDPSFSRRLEAMMDANPRLQITSGFRDGALQGRLYEAGVGMVAPPGQSMHGRGLAADLGPESEMGWIAANAGRFGLESGLNHDEPWHVGMPGTIPIGDLIPDSVPGFGMVDNIIGGITGSGGGGGAGGWIADQVPGLDALQNVASMFMDVFGGIKKAFSGDFSALFGDGGLFDIGSLKDKALGAIGKITGLPLGGGGEGLIDAIAGWLGAGGAKKSPVKSSVDYSQRSSGGAGINAGAYGALGPVFGGGGYASADVSRILQKYEGSNVAPASLGGSRNNVIAALRAASAAGFKGDELIAMTAIAGRESGWVANAHRTTKPKVEVSGDRGLWQINSTHDAALAKAGIIRSNTREGKAGLFDPYINAKAAYLLARPDGSGIDHNWGANAGGWVGSGGSPLYKASQYVQPVYNLAKEIGLVGDPRSRRSAAVGDVASMAKYSPQVMVPSVVAAPVSQGSLTANVSSTPVVINNSFNLNVAGGEADARRVAEVIADHLNSVMANNQYLSN
jgi:hypothetical protein